ncbi:MAG: hypothetical protein IH859_04285 [Chloroflexi bacterium]|nr:hypothetical protein [Chloroflexota bacterium]
MRDSTSCSALFAAINSPPVSPIGFRSRMLGVGSRQANPLPSWKGNRASDRPWGDANGGWTVEAG